MGLREVEVADGLWRDVVALTLHGRFRGRGRREGR